MFRQSFLRKFITMCHKKPASFFSTRTEIFNILVTHLKVNHEGLQKLDKIKADRVITNIPTNKIIGNCKIIHNMDVSLKKIEYLIPCLVLKPNLIRERILILKEMGVKCVGLHHISRFNRTMLTSVAYFKRSHNIPINEDIIKILCHNTNIPIDNIVVQLVKCDSSTSTRECYENFMLYYKTFHLKLHNQLLKENKKKTYRNFTELFKLVNILTNVFQFDRKFLLKNSYLLRLNINNIEQFITVFKDIEIAGKNIIEIIRKHPRILTHDVNKMKELLQLLQTLGIPNQYLINCIEILRLNKTTLLERYMNIASNQNLALWLQYPRVLSLIYHYGRVINRMKYLAYLNIIHQANINTYLNSPKLFLKFVENDTGQKPIKRFLIYILEKELGKDNVYLIHIIQKHPHWKYMSLIHIHETIQYLRKHYTINDICKNIHIILYPRSKVIDALNVLYQTYSLQKRYTPSQYLALCLYELERKYHFSGDAVWQMNYNEKSDVGPNYFNGIEQNKCDNFMKYLNDNNSDVLNLSGTIWLEYLLKPH